MLKLMSQNIAWNTVAPPVTEDLAEAVVAEHFETALILCAQRLRFTAEEQDSPHH